MGLHIKNGVALSPVTPGWEGQGVQPSENFCLIETLGKGSDFYRTGVEWSKQMQPFHLCLYTLFTTKTAAIKQQQQQQESVSQSLFKMLPVVLVTQ